MDGFYRPDFSARVQKLSLENNGVVNDKRGSDHDNGPLHMLDAARASESTQLELHVIDSVDSIPAAEREADGGVVNDDRNILITERATGEVRDDQRLGDTLKALKDCSSGMTAKPHSG